MKVIILLFSALVLISAIELNHGDSHRNSTVFGGFFETPLDHFSPTDSRHLRLTYEVNVEFFEEGGPLFFQTHFEDGFGDGTLHRRGLIYGLARELNGALINSQFRYFGNNRFANATVDILKHMTLDHILADIPYLVNKVKYDLDSEASRVIVFGSRIGGTVAVLARKKFPHIVDGAWSTSGLFAAVRPETDFYEEVANKLLVHGGENCASRLSTAFQQLKEIIDAKNVVKLRELFNITDPIDLSDQQHVQLFYNAVFQEIPFNVYTVHWRDSLGGFQKLCSDMNHTADALESFVRWYNSQFTGERKPLLIYQRKLATFRNTPELFAVEYFFCTQLGTEMRQTNANDSGNLFPNVITQEYYDQWCTDLYGQVYNRTQLDRNIINFNLQHGGGTQLVSNIVITEGSLNPYVDHGVIEYDNEISFYYTTEFYSHSADIYEVEQTDTDELVSLKEEIIDSLKLFIHPEIPGEIPGVT